MGLTTEFEVQMTNLLTGYFASRPEAVVRRQWRPFRGQLVHQYSPVVDIAVGPFAIQERYIAQYDELVRLYRAMIDRLLGYYRDNASDFEFSSQIPRDSSLFVSRGPGRNERRYFNANARCFISVEIEESGSRKHRLGDMINACSLGRIGIIVGWSEKPLRSFLRIAEYLSFLSSVGKPSYTARNLIIVTPNQFRSSIS